MGSGPKAALAFVVTLACGCMLKMPGSSTPPVTSGGTERCREIMETCDNSCQSPDCLQSCTERGTPDAQQLHSAVVSCGQRNFCTSEDCMRASCSGEVDACQADTQDTAGTDSPAQPVADPPSQ
jgi:hypothetical protein